MLLAVLALTVCQTTTYLGYAYSVETDNTFNFLYGMFLAFFNLARSAFLVSEQQPCGAPRCTWHAACALSAG